MARLFESKRDSGFTLIEIMVVMAITSSLMVIAFVGQRTIRSRAQFDAAVEKVVSTVSSAQNQAVAGVNFSTGPNAGTGVTECKGGPAPSGVNQVVFAGTAWTVDGTGANAAFRIDYYKAIPRLTLDATCIFDFQDISLPTNVQMTITPPTGVKGVMFVRTDTGALNVCPLSRQDKTNFDIDAKPFYSSGSCTGGVLNFTLTDADGHTADVQVDTSGLARRLN